VRDIGSNSLAEQGTTRGRDAGASCLATTLDTYASAKGLSRIDFIKADVEGAELGMLRGARAILGAAEPPVLLLEFEEERQRAFGSSCAELGAELRSYDTPCGGSRIGSSPTPRDRAIRRRSTCSRCTRRGRP